MHLEELADSYLGLYFFILWPVVCTLSGVLTGLLLPAPGDHPGLESAACSPVIWVLLLSVFTERVKVMPVAFLVLVLLGWGGTFAGLMLWNLASARADGSGADSPAKLGGGR
jgi:hypothetical protein